MFNWLKTTILMAAIVALFGVIGMAIGGKQGMLIALLLGGAMNFFAYWFSDKMVLKMYNAQEVDAVSSPYLYNMVRELTQRAGLPMPRVYLIDEAQPNAFATGPTKSRALVAVSSGLLNGMRLLGGTRDGADVTMEQATAQDLVATSRLYRQAAVQSDPALASVLEELERTLVEIANGPAHLSAGELDGLRQRSSSGPCAGPPFFQSVTARL